MLNKCLSIRCETVQLQDAEGITDYYLQKVHYSFEFIEDHQEGEQATSAKDENEAAGNVELTDLTPPIRKEASKKEEEYEGERKREGKREQEGEAIRNGDKRVHREEEGDAEAKIVEDQGEGIVDDDAGVQEEGINIDLKVEEDDDFWGVNYCSKVHYSDDGENFPPKWGPNGYHRHHHPLALMVSYKNYLTHKGGIAQPLCMRFT